MVIGTSCQSWGSSVKWAITVLIPQIHIISERNINFLPLSSHMISGMESALEEDNDYDNADLDREKKNNDIKVNTINKAISADQSQPLPNNPRSPLLGQWHQNYLIVTRPSVTMPRSHRNTQIFSHPSDQHPGCQLSQGVTMSPAHTTTSLIMNQLSWTPPSPS